MSNKRQLVYIDTDGQSTTFYSIIDDSFILFLDHNSFDDTYRYFVYPIIYTNGNKYVLEFVSQDYNLRGEGHFSLSTTLYNIQKLIDTAEIIKIVDTQTSAKGVALNWDGCDNAIRVVNKLYSRIFGISTHNQEDNSGRYYQFNIDRYFVSEGQNDPILIPSVTESTDIYVYELSRLTNR